MVLPAPTASVYDRTLAVYIRSQDGNLLRCLGKYHEQIESTWDTIRAAVTLDASNTYQYLRVPFSDVKNGHGDIILDIYERRGDGTGIVGLALLPGMSTYFIGDQSLDQFFADLILKRIGADALNWQEIVGPTNESTVTQIVSLFSDNLRHHAHNDQWEVKGREYFTNRVRFYVQQNATLQLCLPAFPCKSSNPNKVLGTSPDKGEEIALRRLHRFVQRAEDLYPPGAKISIISDGHVFSDCIGVDDETVDEYGARLQQLNRAISMEPGGKTDRVQFQSLVDLLDLRSYLGLTVDQPLKMPELQHKLATILDNTAEICRRILVAGCQPPPEHLRAQIDSEESSTLALYRGFSRFMVEDLDRHPLTEPLSRSQRKKLAAKVSFDMILRNQAYSNLVELLLPDYIRLSIHAHDNSGPKFGIRLFDPETIRAITGLHCLGHPDRDSSDGIISAAHLLYIPTPWHNCIVRVDDDPMLYIMKYGAVKEAVSVHKYDLVLVDHDETKGEGAFIWLKRKRVPMSLSSKCG
ncbi:Pyoverdine/dityrosine biosynthesis protein-domain-containing protein [Aspergillus avenaceus]|uniref:Pyoverdine/dityrosine biosynthesis protein-domain-containing protein n=1 Tax=Aspergillus avenaceus TaxID=36643 RepID=A0A5N6U3F4_ASPAV|nr:Pyoverdine/dityrosine biosynthesis protein-domain-containing protein [Aspergillus avenaceus]